MINEKPIILLLLLSFLLIISGNELLADKRYPISYFKDSKYENAYYTFYKNENHLTSFLFERNISNDNQYIKIWNGIKQNNAKTYIYSDLELMSPIVFNSLIFSPVCIDNKVYLNAFNLDGVKIYEVLLFQSNDKLEIKNLSDINQNIPAIDWKLNSKDNILYLKINTILFELKITHKSLSLKKLENDIIDFDYSDNFNAIYAIKKFDNFNTILKIDQSGNIITLSRVERNDRVHIKLSKSNVVIVNENDENINIKIFKNDSLTIIEDLWLDTYQNMYTINCNTDSSEISFYTLNSIGEGIILKEFTWDSKSKKLIEIIQFKEFQYLNEPISIQKQENNLYVLFRNGIIELNNDMSINAISYLNFGDILNGNVKINKIENSLIVSSSKNTFVFRAYQNSFWLIYFIFDKYGKLILPFAFVFFISILYILYRSQRRQLNTIMNLPNAGFIFITDSKGVLIKANYEAKKLLEMNEMVKMGRFFKYYCVTEYTQPLYELFEKSLTLKESISQKITFINENKLKEFFCRVNPIYNSLGSFKGLVITGVDISEEIERQRLASWAQLAHDMQTNLSTIKLNTEQFEFEEENQNSIRKQKILNQVNIVIQRIRDIVTVGRTQTIIKSPVNSEEILNDVLNEFDASQYPNLIFRIEPKSFEVFCDKSKLIRALRNSIENSIKAIGIIKNGEIILSCKNDLRFAYFIIRDDGKGMDDDTKKRMLTPFFTTGLGSGSFGIGTMIMQNVIEQHGGIMIINSEKGIGTEVIFKLPNLIEIEKNN